MAKRKEPAAVAAVRARERRRSRKRKRAVILALEVIVLVFLMGTAFVMAKYGKFQTVRIDSDDIAINDGVNRDGYTTVALFGGDSREGQLEEGTHADTIIIVSIDNKSKNIRMASVYRDTLLQQMDGTYKKANNAYFVGGPKEAISMLNKNLDLDIEDYVTVDFKAMSDVVDLMGGIEIHVEEAEAEMMNKYIGETAKAAKKKAHKLSGEGTYRLDGPQAVTYSRLRKLAGGDYKRTERQRVVIARLFEKIKTTDIATLNDIVDTVFPQVSTSFSLKEMLALASGVTQYRLTENEGFPFEKTDGNFRNAGSVVIAQGLAENVTELHEFLYPREQAAEATETVQAIASEISYLTGVVRTEQTDGEEASEDGTDVPVISKAEDGSADADGSSADADDGIADADASSAEVGEPAE